MSKKALEEAFKRAGVGRYGKERGATKGASNGASKGQMVPVISEQRVSEGRVNSEQGVSKKVGYSGYFLGEFIKECQKLEASPSGLQWWAVIELRSRRIK